jgi:hypothetical protein
METTLWLTPATLVALFSAGLFFLSGLLTGVWKARWMMTSPDATAPYYVDIAHRASLLYSFACLLLAAFAQLSAWSEPVNLAGVAVPVVLFAGAVKSYVFHGWLKDTDNQLRRPHRLGRWTVPPAMMRLAMTAVIVGEIGGFLVLFTGFLVAILGG